jgi:hypothetical protein
MQLQPDKLRLIINTIRMTTCYVGKRVFCGLIVFAINRPYTDSMRLPDECICTLFERIDNSFCMPAKHFHAFDLLQGEIAKVQRFGA